jgi:hypothetical protein
MTYFGLSQQREAALNRLFLLRIPALSPHQNFIKIANYSPKIDTTSFLIRPYLWYN